MCAIGIGTPGIISTRRSSNSYTKCKKMRSCALLERGARDLDLALVFVVGSTGHQMIEAGHRRSAGDLMA